ncbi:MAG: hypothetical protein RBU37_06950 [Myxococcota bacterium]|jgi:hypothetical protein|nr:hypothetical protein [Myxococcota bacterium]
MRTTSLTLLLVLMAFGCDESTPEGQVPSTFNFDMAEQGSLGITVVQDGQPHEGAIVALFALSAEQTEHAELLWQARSNALGEVNAPYSTLSSQEQLLLVVHAPGSKGPYTDETLRQQLGPVAPAVQLEVDRNALRKLRIPLQSL